MGFRSEVLSLFCVRISVVSLCVLIWAWGFRVLGLGLQLRTGRFSRDWVADHKTGFYEASQVVEIWYFGFREQMGNEMQTGVI